VGRSVVLFFLFVLLFGKALELVAGSSKFEVRTDSGRAWVHSTHLPFGNISFLDIPRLDRKSKKETSHKS
jgi:hypothetical protein